MYKRALAALAVPFLFAILLLMPSTAGITASPELQATAEVSGRVGYVNLNWNTVPEADSYSVYRLDSGGMIHLVKLNAPITSYLDYPRDPGSSYLYYVTAWVGDNESAPSNSISITVPPEEKDVSVLPILAIVLSIIAIQVCIVMLLYFSKLKMQLK